MLAKTQHARYKPLPPLRTRDDDAMEKPNHRRDEFLHEARILFESPLKISNLLNMSAKIQEQFRPRIHASDICMLPSYIHAMPTGEERGTYLALDVGGSTFRVAAVQLNGRKGGSRKQSMEILKMTSFRIDDLVKALKGRCFFEWMAERIGEFLEDQVVREAHGAETVAMGLAWSFPIEQTSARTAKLLKMGKGFYASEGLLNEDLGELIIRACREKHLNVRLDAIINDGQATLMTRAYQDDAVCFGLILGTGTNMSINLPTAAFGPSKLSGRPQAWHAEAESVLVNTEMSMFGKGVLPTTRWDDQLNRTHTYPDFQPLEYMIGGRYIGEIARLVLCEAIQVIGLFGGQHPSRLDHPYSLESSTLAAFEDDTSPTLTTASASLQKHHPLPESPTPSDLATAQTLIRLVTHRASALTALAIHALWSFRNAIENLPAAQAGHVTVGCNGSIIERYPRFLTTTQEYLNQMVVESGGSRGDVVLEVAFESAIFGAAVAAAALEGCE